MGYKTWEDFCDKTLNMHHGKANYFVAIWSKVKDLPKPAQKEFGDIDWTKAREITRVITEANYPKLLEAARHKTYKQLAEVVQKEKSRQVSEHSNPGLGAADDHEEQSSVGDRQGAERTYPMHFQLYEDSYGTVIKALQAAASASHSSNKSYNLQVIAMEFLATHGSPDQKILSDFLNMMERALNATIIVVDNKSTTVIYGQENVGAEQ